METEKKVYSSYILMLLHELTKKDFITAHVKIARIKSATNIAQNRKKSTIVYWTSTSVYKEIIHIYPKWMRATRTRIRVSEILMVNNCNNNINNNNNYNLPYLNASVSVDKAITAAYGKIVLEPLVRYLLYEPTID